MISIKRLAKNVKVIDLKGTPTSSEEGIMAVPIGDSLEKIKSANYSRKFRGSTYGAFTRGILAATNG